MDGWIDLWMDYGWIMDYGLWMDGLWMDDGWMDYGWMDDGWMDEWTDGSVIFYFFSLPQGLIP